MLWELVLAIFRARSMFPFFCLEDPYLLKRCPGGKKRAKKCGRQPPYTSFGLFGVKGIELLVTFDNEASFANRMKPTFISNLWSWFNVYSVDRDNSLLDFLTWLGCR